MGTHPTGKVTKKCDAILTAALLLKFGSDVGHVAVTTAATEKPLGFCHAPTDAIEDSVGVELLTAPGTKTAVAAAQIDHDTLICAAASGRVQAVPGAGGTYYVIGRTLQAAAAAGDEIEVETCAPRAVVVT